MLLPRAAHVIENAVCLLLQSRFVVVTTLSLNSLQAPFDGKMFNAENPRELNEYSCGDSLL